MSISYDLVSTHPTPIFLGGLPSDYAESPADIVVNLCGLMPKGQTHIPTLFCLPMADSMNPEGLPTQETIESFLRAVHVFAEHEATFWHCQAGLNRSSFILATYLHLYRGQPIAKIIHRLRARRHEMVLCNSLFEGLLRSRYGTEDEQAFKSTDIKTYLRERHGQTGPKQG